MSQLQEGKREADREETGELTIDSAYPGSASKSVQEGPEYVGYPEVENKRIFLFNVEFNVEKEKKISI